MDPTTLWISTTVLAAASAIIYLLSVTTPDEEAAKLVDTEPKMAALVEELTNLPASNHKPSLFCDIEGIDLCRYGSISIFTIYVRPTDSVYLVDVHRLKHKAFITASAGGVTFKDVLADRSILKVFFDVRNDSDALFSHYGVALAGTHDLQLMELGARWGSIESRKYVTGLSKAIWNHSTLSLHERSRCQQVKESGIQLFAPEKGGSYEVFNQRPLKQEIIDYCAVDVKVLPSLWEVYNTVLQKPEKKDWRKRVAKATLERVKESQSTHYNPHGAGKVLGPWQSSPS